MSDLELDFTITSENSNSFDPYAEDQARVAAAFQALLRLIFRTFSGAEQREYLDLLDSAMRRGTAAGQLKGLHDVYNEYRRDTAERA